MKEVRISGAIVPNEDKWIYDYFEIEATCPKDVEKGINEAAGDEITFIINSPGGEIGSGSEIWYLINGYQNNTYADVVGYACSAASYLAMGADTIRMTPSALMMIHPVSGGARGNHSVLEKEADTLRICDKAISNVYKLRTGLSNEELLKLMDAETWMDAEKAKELGFIDEIIGYEDEKGKKSAKKMPLYNSFCNLLSEETKEKVRNTVKRPDSEMKQDFLLQCKLNFLKLGGKKNEI